MPNYPLRFYAPPGLIRNNDHALLRAQKNDSYSIRCKCGADMEGISFAKALNNGFTHLRYYHGGRHDLAAAVLTAEGQNWHFLCSCGMESADKNVLIEHFSTSPGSDVSHDFLTDHSFHLSGTVVLVGSNLSVNNELEDTISLFLLQAGKNAVDKKNATSIPPITTNEGDTMLSITAVRTIEGYVGQVHLYWDDEDGGTTIVWESSPYAEDMVENGERVTAAERAREAAKAARNEAMKALFTANLTTKKK